MGRRKNKRNEGGEGGRIEKWKINRKDENEEERKK